MAKLRRLQPGLQHQIQQQSEGFGGSLGRDQDVEVDVVETGGGVAAAPESLDAAVELTGLQPPAGRAPLAALEDHVLEEMGDAALPGGLEGAAGATPEIEADQWSIPELQLHQFDPIGQGATDRHGQTRQKGAATTEGNAHGHMAGSAFCWDDRAMGEQTKGSDGGVHPLVDALAERIRHCRRDLPELAPLAIDPDLEAISGSLDGEALFIRNELHRCRGMRKLHLETARLGAGLQILHCVFFPDPRHDLPVFGADIVAGRGGVTAAIVDLSPVGESLPAPLAAALASRRRPAFAQVRELPPWGSIFSPHVLFVRPVSDAEEQGFIEEVAAFLGVLAEAAAGSTSQAPEDPATVARWQAQLRYCRQQKQNDKTRRVLEKAFNPQWADRYIEQLLFDDPPAPSASV